MEGKAETQTPATLRYSVQGSRRPSVYFWAVALSGGGLGFALAGLSSFSGTNLLPFSDPSQLVFIPQGIAMLFYGVVGSLAGLYQWLSLAWNLGGGYNEFDKGSRTVTLFRQGFPGENREVKLIYPFADVQSVRVAIKDGLNPKRAIFLRVRGHGDLRLTSISEPMALADIENQAAEIARYLGVILEGI
ncbi:MAG: photosystem I assembly protein Ycf4 [Cyanophyceae cyanobacterium]